MNGFEITTLVFLGSIFVRSLLSIVSCLSISEMHEPKKTSVVISKPFIFDIENYETIYSNDLTKIERKKISVVFSEPYLSEMNGSENTTLVFF
jgi:hypothetical protein